MLSKYLGSATCTDREINRYDFDRKLFIPLIGKEIIFSCFALENDSELFKSIDPIVNNLISIDDHMRKRIEVYIYKRYRMIIDDSDIGITWQIISPELVWERCDIDRANIFRNYNSDNLLYVSLYGDCQWDEEHGLELTFKEGRELVKVGGIDGTADRNLEKYD